MMTKERYDPELFALPEAVADGQHVVATYFVQTPAETDIIKRCLGFATEQTTGTWVDVPGETRELRREHAAKLVGLTEVPDYETGLPGGEYSRSFVVRLAFPWVNFGDSFPMLLSTIPGNISFGFPVKLVDIEFPDLFLAKFQGPKFGIEGIRQLLGVHDRPLLNNMIKPCTGFPPEVGADLVYQAAAGGVDIIKDDELLGGSPEFSPLEKRVETYMRAIDKADAEKGEKTLYTVNITDRVERLRDNALQAINAGANALMVNYIATGLSALRMLAGDPEINVPILGHATAGGSMIVSPYSGISAHLIMAKLPRMAGADIINDLVPYGKLPILKNKYLRIAHICRGKLGKLKRTFPNAVAGVYPGNVPEVMADLGKDCILGAGGGIHAHPMGPKAGAIAMRQAIDAALQGVSLEKASKNQPELRAAIETWGIWKEESLGLFARLR
jgi:2,3-diketo-5-methylthiopentyl-1-phosphate enolase